MSDFEQFKQQTFRAASYAGILYPAEGVLIQSALQALGLIQNPKVKTHCVFIPHGSWYITGNALSLGYKSLIEIDDSVKEENTRTISKVVLLGKRHHSHEKGLFLSESDYFETPIGNLMIDKQINEELISCNTLFELNDIPHLQEDMTEPHFPFIKFLFPEASFIPLLIGGFELNTMSSLASALHVVFEPILEETLFIISSNLAHHADFQNSQKQAERFIGLVKEKNGTKLLCNFHEEKISACGTSAMAAMLESGLLEKNICTRIPRSDGHLIDVDNEIIHYAALKFSPKADSAEPFIDRRRGDRRAKTEGQ